MSDNASGLTKIMIPILIGTFVDKVERKRLASIGSLVSALRAFSLLLPYHHGNAKLSLIAVAYLFYVFDESVSSVSAVGILVNIAPRKKLSETVRQSPLITNIAKMSCSAISGLFINYFGVVFAFCFTL